MFENMVLRKIFGPKRGGKINRKTQNCIMKSFFYERICNQIKAVKKSGARTRVVNEINTCFSVEVPEEDRMF
jgi:hypothetical protein